MSETLDPRVLTARAEDGDGAAAHRLAVLSLIGLGVPHDVAAAVQWLDRAAETDADAHAARDLIQRTGGLDSWLTPGRPMVVSRTPHVLTLQGFLAPEVCGRIIARARQGLKPATVYDHRSDREMTVGARDNSAFQVGLEDTDFVLALLRERIARAAGLPVAGLEPTQILHYRPGEKFETHHDYLDPQSPGHLADLSRKGQRVATLLVYLNDDFTGGETEMTSAGLKHRGATGDALMWANVTPDGRPDPTTLHAGLPPVSGEKWVLSQWLRNRAPSPGPA